MGLSVTLWLEITKKRKDYEQNYYYDLVEKTSDWGTYEWTLISKVRDIIVNAAGNPTITYIDNGGAEREVPLYFRNGLKSLFQVELKIDL